MATSIGFNSIGNISDEIQMGNLSFSREFRLKVGVHIWKIIVHKEIKIGIT
jgi:hypothetical protein